MKTVKTYYPDETALRMISVEQAWHYSVVPLEVSDNILVFLCPMSGLGSGQKEELALLLGMGISEVPVEEQELGALLNRFYRRSGEKNTQAAGHIATEAFLDKLIAEAITMKVSDIHIEPFEQMGRIRMRIDGKLIERYTFNAHEYPPLINKIKIRANLDIAEKRLPQDGRVLYENDACRYDIRISIIPAIHGEKVVMRLLNKDSDNISIASLGFSEHQLHDYLEALRKTNGIILINGPTGSGKTTTLYATLKVLNTGETNILTIEDPVEYTLEGVNQVQVKESIGLTFASALRTFLRQDPDIIMLGEIRDRETAEMAIRAALTGHLVLSTIHTNSAWGAINRLTDMGIPAFLIAGTLNASVAQRLVRLLCPHCRKKIPFDSLVIPEGYSMPEIPQYQYISVGCNKCFNTGYSGRKAVFEVIPIDNETALEIKKLNTDIRPLLALRKIRTMSDQAFEMATEGVTSFEEIYPLLMISR